jgi:hypothetical protein
MNFSESELNTAAQDASAATSKTTSLAETMRKAPTMQAAIPFMQTWLQKPWHFKF